MTMTITETTVEERLQPQPMTFTAQKKATKHSVPYSLMRSASFNRLRQFPTYFCRQGSTEIYQWLFSSKNKVSTTFSHVAKQIQQLLLPISIFGALGILVAQLVACLIIVTTNPIPVGFTFLLACTLIIGTLAVQILFPAVPQRRTRASQRSTRD